MRRRRIHAAAGSRSFRRRVAFPVTEGSGSSYAREACRLLSARIPRHLGEGMERDQAIAAATREAREKGPMFR